MHDYACSECGFKLWLPIARLDTTFVGLYDDNRFPGRLIVVLDHHAEHLHEMAAASSYAFVNDARRAGVALAQVTDTHRINYAVLGNTQPHLHWHVIPRDASSEPLPRRPPWEDPRPVGPLDIDQVSTLIDQIARALQATSPDTEERQ